MGAKKTHIYLGLESKFIPTEDLQFYLTLGWSIGHINRPYDMGDRIWINNGTENKRILKKDLPFWLGSVWRQGRSSEYGRKMAEKKWVNLDGKDKRVSPEELPNHPIPPWAKGRSFRYVFTDEDRQKISDGQKRRYSMKREKK